MLNIKKTLEGSKATFALEGRLDTNTAVELEAALQPVTDTVDELVFDFEGVE